MRSGTRNTTLHTGEDISGSTWTIWWVSCSLLVVVRDNLMLGVLPFFAFSSSRLFLSKFFRLFLPSTTIRGCPAHISPEFRRFLRILGLTSWGTWPRYFFVDVCTWFPYHSLFLCVLHLWVSVSHCVRRTTLDFWAVVVPGIDYFLNVKPQFARLSATSVALISRCLNFPWCCFFSNWRPPATSGRTMTTWPVREGDPIRSLAGVPSSSQSWVISWTTSSEKWEEGRQSS